VSTHEYHLGGGEEFQKQSSRSPRHVLSARYISFFFFLHHFLPLLIIISPIQLPPPIYHDNE
jgi:hypothetical protein